MFQGAYSDEFYRALRNALHAEVAAVSAAHAAQDVASTTVRSLWQQVADLEPVSRIASPTILDCRNPRPAQPMLAASGFVPLEALAARTGLVSPAFTDGEEVLTGGSVDLQVRGQLDPFTPVIPRSAEGAQRATRAPRGILGLLPVTGGANG
jgi:hypothetical protein